MQKQKPTNCKLEEMILWKLIYKHIFWKKKKKIQIIFYKKDISFLTLVYEFKWPRGKMFLITIKIKKNKLNIGYILIKLAHGLTW